MRFLLSRLSIRFVACFFYCSCYSCYFICIIFYAYCRRLYHKNEFVFVPVCEMKNIHKIVNFKYLVFFWFSIKTFGCEYVSYSEKIQKVEVTPTEVCHQLFFAKRPKVFFIPQVIFCFASYCMYIFLIFFILCRSASFSLYLY